MDPSERTPEGQDDARAPAPAGQAPDGPAGEPRAVDQAVPPPPGAADALPASTASGERTPSGTPADAEDHATASAGDPPADGPTGAEASPPIHAPDTSAGAGADPTPTDEQGGPARKGRGKKRRAPRPHPYADEASGTAEADVDPRRIAALVIGGGIAAAILGVMLQQRYGYYSSDFAYASWWEDLTRVPLFLGLGLLGIGLLRRPWSHCVSMAGWLLFGTYWALTARDLLVREAQDYVNYAFALSGVVLTAWLAYHHWLDKVRGVRDVGLRFLQVATFVAAGAYFLIDKVQIMRVGLITVVSDHTRDMLGLFGQGRDKGLVFVTDHRDSKSPTTFFYPDKYCLPSRPDAVGEHCRSLPAQEQTVTTFPDVGDSLWDQVRYYTPEGESLLVLPVSIILACTAIQSIMLFVGLIAGTRASTRKKVYASLVVGALVYVLNLVRNTGIIWFYGQGHASFWVMHNAIGKGGSLIAMVLIAVAMFRFFPEFLQALVRVIDLIDRDGPLERLLRIGRRRPEAQPPVAGDA